MWIASLRFHGRSALNTAYIWLAAVTLLWGTALTLLLPWINEPKSYRGVFAQLGAFLEHSPYGNECIANGGLGENIAPMWEYFSGHVAPAEDFNDTTCPLLLIATGRDAPRVLNPRWEMVWRGSRVLDSKNEELRLYHRQ